MFGLAHKFKLGQTQKLMAAALMLAVSPAWAGRVELIQDVLYKEIAPMAEEVCNYVNETIEQTPDFFKRFEQEGYKYILYDSPFRHHSIQSIDPYFVYLVAIQNFARWDQHILTNELDYNGVYDTQPIEKKIKTLEVLKRGVGSDWYKGLGDRLNQHANDYSESYLNNVDVIAYKVRTNFNNRIDVEEYAVGVLNYNGYGLKRPANYESAYFIVDRNGQPHPKMLSHRRYVYENEDKLFPLKIPVFVRGQGVPINVKHRSYDLVVYCYQPNGWEQKAEKCDKGKIELTIMRRIPFGIGYLCEIKF